LGLLRKKGMKKALEEAALANEMTVESAAHERAKRENARERETYCRLHISLEVWRGASFHSTPRALFSLTYTLGNSLGVLISSAPKGTPPPSPQLPYSVRRVPC
jgi:hypothetical protein